MIAMTVQVGLLILLSAMQHSVWALVLVVIWALGVIGFVYNRRRWFRSLNPLVYSRFPGLWPWGLAPTWLWGCIVLPQPFIIAGLLFLISGSPIGALLFLWSGVAIGIEQVVYLRAAIKHLVERTDAEAMANGGALTEESKIAEFRKEFSWLMTAPSRDPQTGAPNFIGPGRIL